MMEDNVTNDENVVVDDNNNSEEEPTIEEIQLAKLKIRIPYDEDIFGNNETYEATLTVLLEDAKHIALAEIYKFEDFYDYDLPMKYLNWQLRAAVELYNLGDKKGILSYSENGLAWTKDSGSLSKDLMGELTRFAKSPRKDEELDV
jgi:hypothetical protein